MFNVKSVRRAGIVSSAAVVALLAGAAAPALALAPKAAAPSPTVTVTSGPVSVTEPVHLAALVRGGATESVTVTLDNSSGKAVSWDPTITTYGAPVGGVSPIWMNEVRLAVQPLNAPHTTTMSRLLDSGFVTQIYPAGQASNARFSIPAKSRLSWKVTFGLNKSYPANDSDVQLNFGYWSGQPVRPGGGSDVPVTVPTSPGIRPGYLRGAPEHRHGGARQAARPVADPAQHRQRPVQLRLAAHDPGHQLRRWRAARPLALQVLENGHWANLAYGDGR
ncbi:hypothetical protein GXW82_24110 [Streptacidiphilus sp. 4-A2]|nr:hypothetical protein [Streptacidiphilus sp. 4-A2]